MNPPAGIICLVMADDYGASGHSRDFGGELFENFDLYWKDSPLRDANDGKTPTLILHVTRERRTPSARADIEDYAQTI